MDLYGGQCAVSRCNVTDVLEAAHVVPYRGALTNHTSNGILLRADLHILFDEGLLGIRPETLAVHLTPDLKTNEHYAQYHDAHVHDAGRSMDRELLRAHWHYCGFE